MSRNNLDTGRLRWAGKRVVAAVLLAITLFCAAAAIAGRDRARSPVVRAGNSWSIMQILPDTLTTSPTDGSN
jgi:hypothetical protein